MRPDRSQAAILMNSNQFLEVLSRYELGPYI